MKKMKKMADKAFSETPFRKMCKLLNEKYNLHAVRESYVYFHLHNLFMFLVAFIAAFNTNMLSLLSLLVVISLDAISIVVLHECPLTILEKKYMKKSSSKMKEECFHKMGVMYECDHDYEKQIEIVVVTWMIVAAKILITLFLTTFQIRLRNDNSLYA